MLLRIERRVPVPRGGPVLLEVVTPRTNAASLTSAENLLGAVGVAEPFSLEIAADHTARRFLVRSSSHGMADQLRAQLGAAYPQAAVRPPVADPARCGSHERWLGCTLGLRAAPYLPLRTFSDLDVDPARAVQADPVLGVLAALGDLPPGWRALSQLVVQPAGDDWSRAYQRLAVQHPLTPERVPRASESSLPSVLLLCAILALVGLGTQVYSAWRAGSWLLVGGLLAAAVLGVCAAVVGVPRVLRRPVYDMDLVREKVNRAAVYADLRLTVIAPASVSLVDLRARLERFAAGYRQFNLAAGNGWRVDGIGRRSALVTLPERLGHGRRATILTTRELAGLWHLPHAVSDVALLERTTARRWLPLPATVTAGCRIGVAAHQGRSVAVSLPEDLLHRHLLLVAKTRRGKSTLLLRLARHAMQSEPRGALLLIDPHQDLAVSALGAIPEARRADVVALDLADPRRPVGLNVLDVGLGWSADRAVASTLSIFQREWGDRHWGPRMEDVFRFALLTLFQVNVARCAAGQRSAQLTLLDIPLLLRDARVRQQILAEAADPTVTRWWSTYFESLEPRFRTEVINPVLTKIGRFLGSTAARRIVGQSESTIDPAAWLRDGAVVIVNTARGTLGEQTAALLGGTLLNLTGLAVAAQAAQPVAARRRIAIVVDEFHTIPGADYDVLLAELAKYGAHLVLATQSLARLEALGAEHGRDLRATVFANLDGLFAFNCSAEDAAYLVPELGGALDEQDLVELGEHQCYVRATSAGERLPTFFVTLDPPLSADAEVAAELAAASAARFGRCAAAVDAALEARLAPSQPHAHTGETVVEPEMPTTARGQARSEHRPRRKKRPTDSEAVRHA